MKTDVDVVILGAGMAGLALARALTGPGRNLSVLVLEPRTLKPDTRLWVFPAAPGHALARFATGETRDVSLAGREARLTASALWTVPAQDVQAAALEALAVSVRARLDTGVRIDGVRAVAGGAEVDSGLGRLRAGQIIDCRPAPDHAVPAGTYAQIVLSCEGRADGLAPGFKLSAPQVEHGGLTFMQRHVLPDGRWLAEAVRFAPPGEAGERLHDRLVQTLPSGAQADGLVVRRTVLPLVTAGRRKGAAGAVIAAPARAGGLRFAVGMEALRLTRWAQGAAHDWTDGRPIAPPPDPGSAARAPAQSLLKRLRQGPGAAAAWLTATLASQDADAALAFLAGAGRER